ncbi:hypothetical protein QBZ16_003392 [Prototheca wickerhamii]|uniref:Uncharacterized protein n=1 Tax=Prototheca wickerhamii TaxID=3111 RepID=A0AAD9IM81_PROWI|nr:hypothetical protein QBZ16_003392 [Prototheca wickerhamii]
MTDPIRWVAVGLKAAWVKDRAESVALLAALLDSGGDWPSTSLIRNVLGASSTDHVEESALNLLIPEERVTFGMGVSYWSSKGSDSAGSVDWVALRLAHPLCLLREIRLRPFKAWFQPGAPIYAPQFVRFRVGGAMLFDPGNWQLGPTWLPPAPPEPPQADDPGGWDAGGGTWESPLFPVDPNSAADQLFELPQPVLCVGGLLVIELIGKVKQQLQDNLFYVCLSYVHVKGRPIAGFAVDPGRSLPAVEVLPVDPLQAQGGLALIGRRLQSAVPPDPIRIVPVHECCCMVSCARKFGIPATAVVLGATYFQRLLSRHSSMLQLAVSSGYFRRCTAGKPSKRKRELVMLRSTAKAPTLLTVYATCIYLALKVCDRVPHVSMLSAMLSYVLHDRVDPAQAVQLEWQCLVGLQWRLGPYFAAPRPAPRETGPHNAEAPPAPDS